MTGGICDCFMLSGAWPVINQSLPESLDGQCDDLERYLSLKGLRVVETRLAITARQVLQSPT